MQFAVHPRDGRHFVVKFFLQQEAFRAEAALYAACFPSLHTQLSAAIISRLPRTGAPPPCLHGLPLQHTVAEPDAASASMRAPWGVVPGGGGGTPDVERGTQQPSTCSRASTECAASLEKDAAPAAGQRYDQLSGGAPPTGTVVMHSDERSLRKADVFRQMPDAAARFLPQVEAVCDDAVDPRGRPLPPCIVMEKGESLQEWSNRAEPDVFASLAVRSLSVVSWLRSRCGCIACYGVMLDYTRHVSGASMQFDLSLLRAACCGIVSLTCHYRACLSVYPAVLLSREPPLHARSSALCVCPH